MPSPPKKGVPVGELDRIADAVRNFESAKHAWHSAFEAARHAKPGDRSASLFLEAARHDLRMAQGRVALEAVLGERLQQQDPPR